MQRELNVRSIMQNITGKCGEESKDISVCFFENCPDGYIPTMNEAMVNIIISKKQYSLDYLSGHRTISYYRQIDNKSRMITFVKRTIRKLIKFCVKPLIEEQNCFNDHLYQIIRAQNFEIELIRDELNELKKTND